MHNYLRNSAQISIHPKPSSFSGVIFVNNLNTPKAAELIFNALGGKGMFFDDEREGRAPRGEKMKCAEGGTPFSDHLHGLPKVVSSCDF